MIERVCKACGKTIQIPDELETFSCVFCGCVMTSADFAPQPVGESDEADRSFVLEHLIAPIEQHPKYTVKYFNRKKYEEAYHDYKRECRPIYEAMERYVLANPERREALLEEFAERFIADWDKLHAEGGRKHQDFADKLTLAFFEVPAIQDMELSCAADYVRIMQRKFVARYPKNTFLPATHEDIASGFQKRKLCFITTAICSFEGKPDDCEELTAFRGFRDGWLTEHGGAGLIAEYYEIAPALVQMIDYCDDSEVRYAELRRDYLQPCFEALQRGENERCRDYYVAMVRSLMQRYLQA